MLVEGLVSTIIPVRDRPALLREAALSVLAQSYRPIEIIIVDDGSTDSTPAVASAMQCMYPREIRVARIPNGGPGAAREAGRHHLALPASALRRRDRLRNVAHAELGDLRSGREPDARAERIDAAVAWLRLG